MNQRSKKYFWNHNNEKMNLNKNFRNKSSFVDLFGIICTPLFAFFDLMKNFVFKIYFYIKQYK
jgi:hypothetical protein